MNKLKSLIALFLCLCMTRGYAQMNQDTDSLAGFDMAGALEHASHLKTSTEKNFFFEHAKRTYKIEKYALLDGYNYNFNKAILPSPIKNPTKGNNNGSGNKVAQGPQPAGCTNV